ncbi:MAG: hypothetical protein ACLGJB_03720 [Blastocatellia bacterium]
MPDPKIDKLLRLMELVQNDTITPKELEKFMLLVLEVIKKSKDSFESLSQENLQKITNALSQIENQHSTVLSEIDDKASKLTTELQAKLKEVQGLIAEVQAIEVKDGKDADPAEAARLAVEMIKLPIVPDPDTGENIVSKINDLPLDPDCQIDVAHIKNLPIQGKTIATGSRYLQNLVDVYITSIANNDVLKWNSTTNRFENGAVSGGSGINRSIVVTSGSVTAGATASTDYVYLVAGAHTVTMPTAASNTNRYTIKNNHSAAITVNTTSSQTIDGGASIQIAPEDSVDLISNNSNWFVI